MSSTSQHSQTSQQPVGSVSNSMGMIGGSFLANMTAVSTKLTNTSMTINDCGSASSMVELAIQIETAGKIATDTESSANAQANQIEWQAGASIGSAGATGVGLIGQGIAVSRSGVGSDADALGDKLAQQQRLDAMANERMSAGDEPGGVVIGRAGAAPAAPAADSPINDAIEARRASLSADGGKNPYAVRPAADGTVPTDVLDRFPGSDKPAYCQSKTVDGETSLDEAAIKRMSTEEDEDGESELSRFRDKLDAAMKNTSNELMAKRTLASTYQGTAQSIGQLLSGAAQGGCNMQSATYSTSKGRADAAVSIGQSATANAQSGYNAAWSRREAGSKQIGDTAQSIQGAIRAVQSA